MFHRKAWASIPEASVFKSAHRECMRVYYDWRTGLVEELHGLPCGGRALS